MSKKIEIELPAIPQWVAEETEKPLCYVQFLKGDNKKVLNKDLINGDLFISSKDECDRFKTKFTEAEIKAIDERYWQFAVPMEE